MLVAISYVIPGARTVDQLHEPTLDGHRDENMKNNCVAASVADGLGMLTGKRFTGDALKDAVYGQRYVGVQAAWRYQQYCADHGVTLSRFTGSQAELVAIIHRQVAAGHPVVVTMPSQWSHAPAHPAHPSGSTHVGLAIGIGPHAIRVMNPWHGFMQDASDDWWEARLCEGEVWVMEVKDAKDAREAEGAAKGATTVTGDATPANQPTPFYGLVYTNDSEIWRCPSTGRSLAHGFLTFYQGLRGPNGQRATELLGLPISEEYAVEQGKTRQDFERGSLLYDARAQDPWRITYVAIAQEVAALRTQAARAQAELTKLRQQSALDAQTIADLKRRLAQLGAGAPTTASGGATSTGATDAPHDPQQ